VPIYPTADVEKNTLRELWKDTTTAEDNGWTLIGTPTIDNGIVLNGTTQRATRNVYTEFASTAITIAVKFSPDFDYDENANRAFFDATNGARYLVTKRDNANNNFLLVILGSVTIANITTAQYSAYWNVGEVNTLVVSGESGNTDAWLNGNKVLDGDSTAWSPKTPTIFYVGSSYTGASLFDGTIYSTEIFQGKWDDAQEEAWRLGTSFSLDIQADIYMDMDRVIGDGTPSNRYRAIEKSKNGNHPFLGTGNSLVNAPVYKNPGFEYNGTSSRYLEWNNQVGFYNNTEQTIISCFTPYFQTDVNVDRYVYDSENTKRYLLIKRANAQNNILWAYLGNTGLPSIAETTYKPYWRAYGKNVVIVSGKSGHNNMWLNGYKLLDEDTTVWTPDDPATIQIGIYYGKDNFKFDGIIHHFSTYPFLIGSIQVDYITRRLLRG
jgi:hypothetical protein